MRLHNHGFRPAPEARLWVSLADCFERSSWLAQRWLRRWLFLACCLLLLLLPAEAAIVPETPSLITNISQIQALQLTPNAPPVKVRIDAVLTFHDPSRQQSFAQDATGGICIRPSPTEDGLQTGQHVIIEGEVTRMGSERCIRPSKVSSLGVGHMPNPAEVNNARQLLESLNAQWVHVAGIVRAVSQNNNYLVLRVAIRGGEFDAVISSPAAWQKKESLEDSKISLVGVASSSSMSERRSGRTRVHVSSGSLVTPVSPSAGEPFELPTRSIMHLLQNTDATTEPCPRAHLQGIVTALFPDGTLYLRDDVPEGENPGNIRVRTLTQPNNIEVGTLVEVSGFPQFDGGTLELADATLGWGGDRRSAEPRDLLSRQVPTRAWEGQLIRFNGRVISTGFQTNQTLILIDFNGGVVQGVLREGNPTKLPTLRSGSLVEVIGICTRLRTGRSDGELFQVSLRSVKDLRLLPDSQFLGSPQVMTALAVLIGISILAFTWVGTLRVRLAQQTGLIRQRLEREASLERRYSELVETAPDLILTYDLQGKILSMNRAGEELSGYTRDEALGMQLEKLIQSHRDASLLLHGFVAGKESQRAEIALMTRYGEKIPMEARWQILASRGQPTEIQCIARDIRERRRAQEALRKSEEHLRLAIESAAMSTWEYYPESGHAVWHSRFPQRGDAAPSQAEWQMDGVLEHIHPADRAGLQSTLETSCTTGEPFQVEYRVQRPDGQRQWHQMQGRGLRDEAGKVIRVLGVSQDVTPRKQAEQALREREEIYRAMFEKNRAVKLLLDPDTGEIVDANAAAARFYGYTLDDLRSKRLQELNVISETSTLDLLKRAESGENDIFHLRQTLATGESRDVEVYAGLLVVGGRHLMFCIVLDVSEQVRATEAMQRLNEELEGRVNERTIELQNRIAEVEQLNNHMMALLEDLKVAHLETAEAARSTEAANLQLQTTNQELEAFSYSVSHDLRAPLRHIAGYAALLEESHSGALNAEGLRYLSVIGRAAKRMGELIDDLLAFSRIGRAELSLRKIALDDIVQQIIRDLRPELEKREVVWRLHSLPEVNVDPSLIRQVLLNLIENAVKYSRPRDRAIIEIGVGAPSHLDEHVIFVRDNGVGFDMGYVEKLFGVFQRLHTASEFEGTGIGLANVRRIIARHGGRTWAEAELGKGATFYFSLPRQPQQRAVRDESHSLGA